MIAIRAAEPGDATAIAAIYAPHVLTGVASFETAPPDAAAMAARMDGLYPWLVATDGSAGVIGYACAAAFHPREAYRRTVETSVYVDEAAQGRGVGRRLYQALLETLAAHGFTQAIARIALPNPGSIALHEAVGFRHAGELRAVGCKRGRWIDVGLWQATLAHSPPSC